MANQTWHLNRAIGGIAYKCARPTWNRQTDPRTTRFGRGRRPCRQPRKNLSEPAPGERAVATRGDAVTRMTTAPSAARSRAYDPCASHWLACGSWPNPSLFRLSWPCRRCGARTSRPGPPRASSPCRQPARLRWAFAACGAISFALIRASTVPRTKRAGRDRPAEAKPSAPGPRSTRSARTNKPRQYRQRRVGCVPFQSHNGFSETRKESQGRERSHARVFPCCLEGIRADHACHGRPRRWRPQAPLRAETEAKVRNKLLIRMRRGSDR